MSERVLLILPTTTYKAQDFVDAAIALGVQVVVASDSRQALEDQAPGHTLEIVPGDVAESLRRIRGLARERPFAAVVGVDDETVVLAAEASAALGLPHNPLEAVRAARDKYDTRRRLAAAGLHGPGFALEPVDEDPRSAAERAVYPCVLKPRHLSASRGVLRADGPQEFVAAFRRIARLLEEPDVRSRQGDARHLLVESFLPGPEVAIEGLLSGGGLQVLALFDKPDPLEGPAFEETLYVTPSRLPAALCAEVEREAALGCRALGLVDGPVHAELRLDRGRPWLLEIAPRTIGGLCSRALRFGVGVSLEELVLRHALGRGTSGLEREARAAGVMMIPVPRRGTLRRVDGLERARAVSGVREVTITAHPGSELVPLPEGHRYPGFIIAGGPGPQDVEAALREACAALCFVLDS